MTDLFFTILNFIVLLVVLIGAIKYALVPMLSKQRSEEEKSFRNLVKERTKTHELYRRRVQEGQEAKHLIHQLRGKVKRWNAVVTKEDTLYNQKREQQKAKAYEIQKAQHAAMQSTIAYRQILPNALNKAERELAEHYQDEKNQKRYIESIFKNIGEIQ